jgi:hypothetical protein
MKDTWANSKQRALPDRATVLSYLEDLIAEKRSREEVADWASQFIRGDYDHIRVRDWPAWEMLSVLAGADIKDSPTEYLYIKEDFGGWAKRLKEET